MVLVMNGYMDKILYVNLSKETTSIETFPDDLKRSYLGARGLGVKILADRFEELGDPLGETNVLIFATGPITGTAIPMGSRYEVITKSPLTGTITSANSVGMFGWKIKRAGFDAVVVTGKAKTPKYILLDNGKAELRDASALWGKTTSDTTNCLQQELKDRAVKVACIGPAGEKLDLLACVVNDKFRAAGRGGWEP